jgi:hypothetical protein
MTQDDTMQTSLRSDVVDALAHLSTSTGGFLVTQTNDFGRPLARIGEDIRGYYEASYVPSTPAAPGQFRRIEVRLARKDLRVQTLPLARRQMLQPGTYDVKVTISKENLSAEESTTITVGS